MRCGRADIVDNGRIEQGYICAGGQIVAGHEGGATAARRFYLHDRLGSVREVISASGAVVKYATYEPFGEAAESGGSLADPFGFTGQYYDCEIAQYHLRARQYDPHISRFTSRDPVFGKFEEPITLHKYLYCGNDPVNRVDPQGLWAAYATGTFMVSLGFSYIRQTGLVIDEHGNIGTMQLDGWGVGSPAHSIGTSFGFSPNAKSIEDLGGTFYSAGGTIPVPGMGTFEGFCSWDTGVWGYEWTLGKTYPAVPPGYSWPEGHVHRTVTTITPLNVNYWDILDGMSRIFTEAFNNATTLGEAYLYLVIDGIVRQATDGRTGLVDFVP